MNQKRSITLDGELIAEEHEAGYEPPGLRLGDENLVHILCREFGVLDPSGAGGESSFGRVRLTVERLD